jgi:hypothetical protein
MKEIARDAAETRVEAMQAQVADLQSQVLSLLSFNLQRQKVIFESLSRNMVLKFFSTTQIRDLMKSCSENVKEFLSREREIEKERRSGKKLMPRA